MKQTAICSGLGWRDPCAKRDQCANYVHWTLDRRSDFNVCSPTGKLKHFVQIGAPAPTAKPTPQQDFFS
jgi:hypothetical protein